MKLAQQRCPVPDPTDLASHLGRMSLGDDGRGKVPISVGGETFFFAHPSVLAPRSPFFKDHLLSSRDITFHGMEPDAFRALLRFMYVNTLPGQEELATELLHRLIAAADMLRMDELKARYAQKMWERVTPENVAVTLCCAEAHNCPELKARCIDFFFSPAENLKTVAFTEGYFQIIKFFPWVFDELKQEWQRRQAQRESKSVL
jgi:speckle-type POZ protein